jgi:hypothetical protein
MTDSASATEGRVFRGGRLLQLVRCQSACRRGRADHEVVNRMRRLCLRTRRTAAGVAAERQVWDHCCSALAHGRRQPPGGLRLLPQPRKQRINATRWQRRAGSGQPALPGPIDGAHQAGQHGDGQALRVNGQVGSVLHAELSARRFVDCLGHFLGSAICPFWGSPSRRVCQMAGRCVAGDASQAAAALHRSTLRRWSAV